MPMTYKRVIEETASDEIYNDDWFLKDSPSNDTKKIQGSVLKRLMQSGLKEMLTQTEYNALPSTKLSDDVIYYITDTSKIIINGVVYGSGGGGGGSSYTDVTGTLVAGNTTVTITNEAIVTTATFDFYTDTYGVNPIDISVSTGSITLTFEEQVSDVIVKVRIS